MGRSLPAYESCGTSLPRHATVRIRDMNPTAWGRGGVKTRLHFFAVGQLAQFEASDCVAVVHMCTNRVVAAGPVGKFFAYYEKCGVFTQPRPTAAAQALKL